VAACLHGYAVLRLTSHIGTGYPYTTSVDVNAGFKWIVLLGPRQTPGEYAL